MNKEDMKRRTKHFALNIIRLVASLPQGQITEVIGRQLLRSGTPVGSNYRSDCRAKSTADFISKMGVVEEEANETMYWMELLIESGLARQDDPTHLLDEANQILAITVSSIKTARRNNK
jgi:four helix bundle protein